MRGSRGCLRLRVRVDEGLRLELDLGLDLRGRSLRLPSVDDRLRLDLRQSRDLRGVHRDEAVATRLGGCDDRLRLRRRLDHRLRLSLPVGRFRALDGFMEGFVEARGRGGRK